MHANVKSLLNLDEASPSAMPFDMDTPGKRVRWALYDVRREDAAWLSTKLGITRSAVSQWWAPKKPSSPRDRIPEIASLLGVNEKWLRDGTGSPIARDDATRGTSQSPHGAVRFGTEINAANEVFTLGEVGAGVWTVVDEINDLNFARETSAFPPIPDYPIGKQYDLIVRGTSIDCFAGDGERVRCVSIDVLDCQHGDYVHVKRYRNQRGEVEHTIKRAFNVNGRWELRFHSSDQRWQSQPALILGSGENEQVEIEGIALWQFRPSPTRSRRA